MSPEAHVTGSAQRNTNWSSVEQEADANNLKKVPEAKKRTNHKRN